MAANNSLEQEFHQNESRKSQEEGGSHWWSSPAGTFNFRIDGTFTNLNIRWRRRTLRLWKTVLHNWKASHTSCSKKHRDKDQSQESLHGDEQAQGKTEHPRSSSMVENISASLRLQEGSFSSGASCDVLVPINYHAWVIFAPTYEGRRRTRPTSLFFKFLVSIS